MTRLLVFLLLALPLAGRAATISSTTCPGSGCVVTYLGNLPATAVSVQVDGTWTGTLAFEGSNDGTTYLPLLAQTTTTPAVYTSTTTSNGRWLIPALGALYVRVRASAWTSGSANVLPQPTSSAALQESVTVSTPDGGLAVNLGTATVNTAVATPDGGLPVTLGAQRVAVEATGPDGDPVAVFGSVNATLTPATIAALGPPICSVAEAHRHNLGTTPEILPTPLPDGGTGVIPGRSSWTVINVATTDVKTISCRVDPGDGGLPDCAIPGHGLTVPANGGSLTFPVRDNEKVRCVACTTATTIEHTEEACVQQ